MHRHRLVRRQLALSACDTAPTAPVQVPTKQIVRAHGNAADPFNPIAQGLARALTNPNLRQQLLEDLRDSPFPEYAIELASYLRGHRGRAIAAAMASHDRERASIQAALEASGPLMLVMPIAYDRAYWTGGTDLVVIDRA